MTESRLRAVPCTRYISRFFETTLVYLYSLASATTLSRRENSEGGKFHASNARKILWHRIRGLVRGRKEHSSELLRQCIFLEDTISLLFVPLVLLRLWNEYYLNTYMYIYIYILGLNLKKRTRENFGRTKDRWNFNISINVEGVNNSKLISLSLLNWTCAKRKMTCFQVCRFKLEIFKFKIEKKKKKEMNLHK